MNQTGKKILRRRSGMTMVNVLVAFLILVMTALMFSQVNVLAQKLMARADLIRQKQTQLMQNYYLDALGDPEKQEETYQWKDQNGNSFSFSADICRYSDENGAVYSVGEHRTVTEPEVADQ